MKKFLLSMAAAVLALTASAGEISLVWGDGYWPKNSAYTGTVVSEVEFGGSTWTLAGFNNNNNGWSNVRCGRKGNASVASIYNNAALDFKVTSIVLNTSLEKSADKDKINGVKLVISRAADFSNPVEVAFDGYTEYGEWTIAVPEANAEYGYFKVEFDCMSAGNNGFLGINTFVVNVEGDVEEPDQPEQPDQPEAPQGVITVAKALELIADGYNGTATVKGVITSITEISASYGNATYLIKDAATDAKALTVYRGYGLNGDKFTSEDQLAVGATVTVEGTILNYNGTPEFTTGSKILEYKAPEGGGEQPDQPGPGSDGDVSIVWKDQGYENAQALTTVEKDDVTITFDKGTNNNSAPAYYNTGTAIRLYGGNTMTISVPEGTALAKIEFTTGSTNPFNEASTASNGTFTISQNTWVATSNNVGSVTFTQGGTSGHVRIETTTIYLQEAGDDDRVGDDNGSEEPAPAIKMTVKEALDAIANNQIPAGKVQVEGIISSITEYSTSYGNATYLIVDAKGDENALTVFRCKWLNNASFSEEGLIEVDGKVVVEGTLQDYNGTPELTGCYVVSYTAPEGGDQPGEDAEDVTENFTNGIGLPEGSANSPKEAAEYTSTETGITYEILNCYTNNGYLMINGKENASAYISWSLDFPMTQLVMKTTNGASENAANAVNIYANDNVIVENYQVNVRNATYTVDIPEAYQAAGTVYKVESNTDKYNTQFVSFTYVNGDTTTGVENVEAAESEAVYYNLQGVRVANPERGIFVKVVGGKATKVVK